MIGVEVVLTNRKYSESCSADIPGFGAPSRVEAGPLAVGNAVFHLLRRSLPVVVCLSILTERSTLTSSHFILPDAMTIPRRLTGIVSLKVV